LKPEQIRKLQVKAEEIREWVIKMAVRAGKGHVTPAFSITDLLVVLYFDILRINPSDPRWKERDRFILSKGHGCLAFYAVLAEAGFFPTDLLESFSQLGSPLGGHPDRFRSPGVEASTGSLGHGLYVGTGMAWAGKFDKTDYHVVVLMGDGETDEGSIWEAAMFASHHRLDNLIGIVDRNRLQMTDATERVVSLEPVTEKWRSFGWSVQEIDGHDLPQIRESLSLAFASHQGKPHLILAHTVKGKGVSFMENRPEWHFRIPSTDETAQAMEEIRVRIEALRRTADAAN
jgi:transketolase